jgi:hypothetical protein
VAFQYLTLVNLSASVSLSGFDPQILFFADLNHPMPHDGLLSNLQFPFVTENQVQDGWSDCVVRLCWDGLPLLPGCPFPPCFMGLLVAMNWVDETLLPRADDANLHSWPA